MIFTFIVCLLMTVSVGIGALGVLNTRARRPDMWAVNRKLWGAKALVCASATVCQVLSMLLRDSANPFWDLIILSLSITLTGYCVHVYKGCKNLETLASSRGRKEAA
jgi:hypothetical protein